MPNIVRRKVFRKSYKNMSLREFEQLASKNNINKFDIDAKLSKNLNRMLLMKKDDPYLSHKHQVYLKKQLHKAIEKTGIVPPNIVIHKDPHK